MILPLAPRDHAVLADRLAHQEDRADVQVHHLVPGLERMILGRRAPGRAGVVDQDVDLAEPADRVLRDAHDLARLAQVGGDPDCLDAVALELRRRFLEVAGLARREHDLGAGLAERLGDLQAEAARAAGDERGLAREIEQLSDVVLMSVSPEASAQGAALRPGHARANPHQHAAGGDDEPHQRRDRREIPAHERSLPARARAHHDACRGGAPDRRRAARGVPDDASAIAPSSGWRDSCTTAARSRRRFTSSTR